MLRLFRGRNLLVDRPSSSIASLFSSMEYGSAPEDDSHARAWLSSHGNFFGTFINNKWDKDSSKATAPSVSPSTQEVLADTTQASQEDVDNAVAAAKKAFDGWSALSPHARARHLYSIARNMQKHSR